MEMENKNWGLRIVFMMVLVVGIFYHMGLAKAGTKTFTTPGISTYTAPVDGLYTFSLAGSAGAGSRITYGAGGSVDGDYNLKAGDVIRMEIGTRGNNGSGTGQYAGGGATRIYLNTTGTLSMMAQAAGGGGGPQGGNGGAGNGAGGADVGAGAGTGGSSGSGGGASYDYTYETGYYSDTPGCQYGQDPNNYTCDTWNPTGYATKPGNPGNGGINKNGSKALQFYVSRNAVNTGDGYVNITAPTSPPTLSISYPNTGWTNTNQSMTATAKAGTAAIDAIQGPDGVWKSGVSSLTIPISANGKYTFNVRDVSGETATASYTVTNIDKVNPYGTVSAVTNANGTVTLTLGGIGDAASGVFLVTRPDGTTVQNVTSTSYTVSANGTYTFLIDDVAGNQVSVPYTVSTIDSVAPTGNLTQSPASGTWTNGNVTLTMSGVADTGGSGYKEMVKPDGSIVTTTSATHVVTANGTYTFKLRDNAGNEAVKSITVSNIDKTAPTSTTSQSPANGTWTSGSVTLTVSSAADAGGSGFKQIAKPDGSIVTTTSTTYAVSANGTYTFTLSDNAGNTTLKTFTVSNIDKVLPYGTLSTVQSGGTVTLNLTGIGDGESGLASVTLPDGSVVTGVTSTSYEATSNGTYTFMIRDNVGNVRPVSTNVTTVDTEAPTGTVTANTTAWTNSNVTLTMGSVTDAGGSGFKQIKKPDGTIVTTTSTTYVVSSNGTYTFELMDNAGNTQAVSYAVTNIDKTIPTANNVTQSPAPPSWTSGNVTLTITGAADAGGSGFKDITKPDGTKVTTTSTTHVVTGNGTYSFVITDNAGNTVTKSITVTNIDKTAPTGTLTQAGSGANVTLTLSGAADAGGSGFMNIELPDGTLVTTTSATYVATSNGTYTFKIRDWAGNITTRSISVTAVDSTPPTGNISVDTTAWTNGNVVITVSGVVDVGSSGFKQITKPDGSVVTTTSTTYTATANGVYDFELMDNAGNTSILSYTVTNIDKTGPTGNLVQSPANGTWTNGNVTLTVSGVSDGSGSGVLNIERPDGSIVTGTSTSYTVTANGTYAFRLRDNAGNMTTKSVTVTNIDKVAPTGTITPPPTAWTNDNVVLDLTGVADTGGSGLKEIELPVSGTKVTGTSATYNAPANGTYTYKIYDNAGNVTSKSYTVTNIDTAAPTANLAANTTSWTNGNVVLTLSGAADTGGSGLSTIKRPDGTTSTGTSATYTVTSNGTYVFEVADNAGNVTVKSITVSNIDKTIPIGTLSQSPVTSVWTSGDVTLTLSSVSDAGGSGLKDITKPDGTKVTGTSTTYTATSNGTYTFVISDNAGNTATRTIVVSNIDKVNPTADLVSLNTSWTSGNVTLRLQTIGDIGSGVSMVKLPNGVSQANTGQSVDYVVTANGTYNFEITDVAGNTALKTIVVTNIDKNAPNIPSMVLSSENWSQPGVTITLTSNGDISGGSGMNRMEYRLNGGTWVTYSSVVTIPTSYVGTVKVEARAIDNVGLASGIVTKTTKVDNTLPVIRDFSIFEVSGRQELRVDAIDNESGLNATAYQFYRKEVGTDVDFVKVPVSWVSSNTVVLPTTPSNTKFVYKVEVRDVVNNIATSSEVAYVSPVVLEFGGIRIGDNPNTVTFDLLKGLSADGETTVEITRGSDVIGRMATGDVYRDRGLDYDRTYSYTLVAYTMVGGRKVESLPITVSYKIGAPTIEVYAGSESFTTPFSTKFTVRGTSRIKAGGTLLISLWDGATKLKDGRQNLAAYNTEDWSIEATYEGTTSKTIDVLLQLEGQEDIHNKRIPITVTQKKLSVADVAVPSTYGIYR